MRIVFSLTLSLVLAAGAAMAGEGDPSKALSDAERARLKSQVEGLEKSKLQAADSANKATRDTATRKTQEVNQRLKQADQQVDKAVESLDWTVGKDRAQMAGTLKKRELNAQAAAEKEKIARDARQKAASQAVAAKKAAENINQSVEGLKSQVSQGGKYGLQPKGSNLYVRTYGKN